MTRLNLIEALIAKAPHGDTCAEEIADAIAPVVSLLRRWAEHTTEYRDLYPLVSDEQFKAWLHAERDLLAALRDSGGGR